MTASGLPKHPFNLSYVLLKARLTITRVLVWPLVRYAVHAGSAVTGGVSRRTIYVPSREPGRSIKVFVHQKVGDEAKALPVLINAHGSGFWLSLHGVDYDMCQFFARELNAVVLDTDYRKAPEHPFPAAQQDIEDVVAYVHSRPEEYDTSRVALAGASAGGTLALSVSNSYSERPNTSVATEGGASKAQHPICAVVALYPACDFTIPAITKRAPNSDRKLTAQEGLTPKGAAIAQRAYLAPGQDVADPRLTLKKQKLEAFPKHVIVITGDYDLLYEEGEAFVKWLQEEKHPDATFIAMPGAGHAFNYRPKSESARVQQKAAYDAMAATIRRGWANNAVTQDTPSAEA